MNIESVKRNPTVKEKADDDEHDKTVEADYAAKGKGKCGPNWTRPLFDSGRLDGINQIDIVKFLATSEGPLNPIMGGDARVYTLGTYNKFPPARQHVR